MPLSTFAARTFRADTFTTALGQQRPEVVQPAQQNTGGTILPFRKRATTPEVFTEVKALWEIAPPVAVVPPALFRPPAPPLPEKSPDIVYPAPLPERERKGITTTTPRFRIYAQPATATVQTANVLEGANSVGVTNYGIAIPAGSAEAANKLGAGVTLHQVSLPTVVRNLTDEELVAVALGMI